MLVGLVQLAAGSRTQSFLGSAQAALREFLAAFGGVTDAAGRGFSRLRFQPSEIGEADFGEAAHAERALSCRR